MSWVEWVEITFKSIVVVGVGVGAILAQGYVCWRWGFEDGVRAVTDKMK